jgi:hypothetical protein
MRERGSKIIDRITMGKVPRLPEGHPVRTVYEYAQSTCPENIHPDEAMRWLRLDPNTNFDTSFSLPNRSKGKKRK